MENNNANTVAPRAVFRTQRRTPSARGKSWAGTILFILIIPVTVIFSVLFYNNLNSFGGFIVVIVPCAMLAMAIVCWARSGIEQNGTLSFYDDRIVHICRQERFDMLPGQITSASYGGNVVKIVFSGKTLTLVSSQAAEIVQNVNAFISAYPFAGTNYGAPVAPAPMVPVATPMTPVAAPVAAPVAPAPAAPAAPVVDKAEEIRKYKQLVDDGVISQEQFDAIIQRMN